MSQSYRLIGDDADREGLILITISGQYADELRAEVHWPELPGMPAGFEAFDDVNHALLRADIIAADHDLPRASVSMENPTLWDAGWGPITSDQSQR